MATAARITADQRAIVIERVGALRNRLAEGLAASVPDVVETGVPLTRFVSEELFGEAALADLDHADRSHKVAGSCHVCFDGIESESLLFLLEKAEVYASAASSCASGAQEPSHVLSAMGVPRSLAMGSLRLSLGFASTDDDVDAALAAIPPAVERLRRFA